MYVQSSVRTLMILYFLSNSTVYAGGTLRIGRYMGRHSSQLIHWHCAIPDPLPSDPLPSDPLHVALHFLIIRIGYLDTVQH